MTDKQDTPNLEPGDGVALQVPMEKAIREIRDILQLMRGTDSFTDSGQYIAEIATASQDFENHCQLTGEYPYGLVPEQPRQIYLYANESIYPFMVVPANTATTFVFPRLRTLRIVAKATANNDAVIVELSSREYKSSNVNDTIGESLHTITDTDPNPTVGGVESYLMGWDAVNSVWKRIKVGSASVASAAIASVIARSNASIDGASNTVGFLYDLTGTQLALQVYQDVYNGLTWDRLRTPNVFKSLTTAAVGPTALWTPGAGKKFRLMRFKIDVSSNAIAAAGAGKIIALLDNATNMNLDHSVFVPAAAVAVTPLLSTGWIDLGNGILSAAANNPLNVTLSTALTGGDVRIIAAGTEE